MSDTQALIQEKKELINKMLEMQQKFIELEHKQGVTGKDYYASKDGLLATYRDEYQEIANSVVDLAHEIVGSERNF